MNIAFGTVSPRAAEINKNWNVNEVKTDKNRYHH